MLSAKLRISKKKVLYIFLNVDSPIYQFSSIIKCIILNSQSHVQMDSNIHIVKYIQQNASSLNNRFC